MSASTEKIAFAAGISQAAMKMNLYSDLDVDTDDLMKTNDVNELLAACAIGLFGYVVMAATLCVLMNIRV